MNTEMFRCGDGGSLAAFVYDECEPREREVIAAHVALCRICAEEIASLTATRATLTAWRPPDVALGFRITRADAAGLSPEQPGEATVLRPARWWRQPLPAWAQAAAAAAIFASGLAVGAARTDSAAALPTPITRTAPAATVPTGVAEPPTTVTDAVSARDLAEVERRLRADIAQLQLATARAQMVRRGEPGDGENVMGQVRALVAESEQRQRRELALRTAEVVRDFDAQRRVDMTQVQRSMGQLQIVAGAAARDQEQMGRFLRNVSQSR